MEPATSACEATTANIEHTDPESKQEKIEALKVKAQIAASITTTTLQMNEKNLAEEQKSSESIATERTTDIEPKSTAEANQTNGTELENFSNQKSADQLNSGSENTDDSNKNVSF